MKYNMRWLAALVAAIGLVSFADAQQPGGGRPGGGFGGRGGPGGGGMMRLIVNPAVQDEIKLTDDQKDKLATWYEGFNEKIEEKSKGIERNRENFAKLMAIRTEVSENAEKELKDVLKPDQIKRIKQIEFQMMGTRALQNEDVQKELGITDEQKEKFTKIGEESREAFRDVFSGGRPDREKMQEMMAKQGEKYQEVLTSSQKTKWKEMTGEAFDVSKLQQGGPGGGRQRRPNNDDN